MLWMWALYEYTGSVFLLVAPYFQLPMLNMLKYTYLLALANRRESRSNACFLVFIQTPSDLIDSTSSWPLAKQPQIDIFRSCEFPTRPYINIMCHNSQVHQQPIGWSSYIKRYPHGQNFSQHCLHAEVSVYYCIGLAISLCIGYILYNI